MGQKRSNLAHVKGREAADRRELTTEVDLGFFCGTGSVARIGELETVRGASVATGHPIALYAAQICEELRGGRESPPQLSSEERAYQRRPPPPPLPPRSRLSRPPPPPPPMLRPRGPPPPPPPSRGRASFTLILRPFRSTSFNVSIAFAASLESAISTKPKPRD